MKCQIYILYKQKSFVWEPEIQFWPPKYFESHVIEEKSKKPPKSLTSEILTITLPPIISSTNHCTVKFVKSADL